MSKILKQRIEIKPDILVFPTANITESNEERPFWSLFLEFNMKLRAAALAYGPYLEATSQGWIINDVPANAAVRVCNFFLPTAECHSAELWLKRE